MNRRRMVGVALVAGAVGLVAALLASNVLRRTAEARFSRGEHGLNALRVRGPSGLTCVVYNVVPGLDGRPVLGGFGAGTLPLFGDSVEQTSYYPDAGEVLGVVPEQHVRLTGAISPAAAMEPPRAGAEGRYGTFMVVTRDPSWPGRLATDAPALQSPAPAPPR